MRSAKLGHPKALNAQNPFFQKRIIFPKKYLTFHHLLLLSYLFLGSLINLTVGEAFSESQSRVAYFTGLAIAGRIVRCRALIIM